MVLVVLKGETAEKGSKVKRTACRGGFAITEKRKPL